MRPCENGCGRSYPKDTKHMTLVVTADGAFVELCDPCHRAYRAGYDAAEELARLERRNAERDFARLDRRLARR